MKAKMKAAYKALEKMGVTVYENQYGLDKFSISATGDDEGVWVDYYSADWDFGVRQDLTQVLLGFGLFAEWVNPEVLNVNYI